MIRNETMAALNPTVILATAILCMMDENLSLLSDLPRLILLDMKYERFKEWLNFGFTMPK
jgi:hypothetical protein